MSRVHAQSGVLPSDLTTHTRQLMQRLVWDGVHRGPELLLKAAEVNAGMVVRCQRMLSLKSVACQRPDSRLVSQGGVRE